MLLPPTAPPALISWYAQGSGQRQPRPPHEELIRVPANTVGPKMDRSIHVHRSGYRYAGASDIVGKHTRPEPGSALTGRLDTLEFLRRTDLFGGVSRQRLNRIADGMVAVDVPADGVLFNKGDVGDAVYFVLEGRVHLEAGGIVLLTRGPGECIGEFALIDDVPRSASAVADLDSRLLRWGRDSFRAALNRTPAIAAGVFRLLTGKLRQDVSIQVKYSLEQERWKQDLERARQIQTGMLPASDLAHALVEVSGHSRPAQDVGGDYYDYVWIDRDHLGLVIADVTGHGFYSALFVAMAKSCVHTQTQIDHGPAKIMAALRRVLSLSLHRSLLMSCCYLSLDFRSRTLTYANAGHPFPYLCRHRGGEIEPLPPLDPILGAQGTEAPMFSEEVTGWERGDLVVLYTDGVTEARDRNGELYGHERLEATIARHREAPVKRIRDAILDDVSRHGEGGVQADDLTLVVVRAV